VWLILDYQWLYLKREELAVELAVEHVFLLVEDAMFDQRLELMWWGIWLIC